MLDRKKLALSDIGYHGKPLNELNREELLKTFIELSQVVYDCAAEGNKCKDIFAVKD